jgi:hypothetical protein
VKVDRAPDPVAKKPRVNACEHASPELTERVDGNAHSTTKPPHYGCAHGI